MADAGVTEMMLMCSPQRDHGPARWHRDFSAEHAAPIQGYAEDIARGGARYVQWNMALYDDEVLWVVPGSHNRLNTAGENAQMAIDDSVPLPGAIQVRLRAGDAAVYILPLLHWASNYSTVLRRCPHGGFAEFSHYPGLSSYVHTLQPTAQAMFQRWESRYHEKVSMAEEALRGALVDRATYVAALDRLHPGVALGREPGGAEVRRQSTAFLSKAARRISFLQSSSDTPDDAVAVGALGLGAAVMGGLETVCP